MGYSNQNLYCCIRIFPERRAGPQCARDFLCSSWFIPDVWVVIWFWGLQPTGL